MLLSPFSMNLVYFQKECIKHKNGCAELKDEGVAQPPKLFWPSGICLVRLPFISKQKNQKQFYDARIHTVAVSTAALV